MIFEDILHVRMMLSKVSQLHEVMGNYFSPIWMVIVSHGDF